MIKIKVYIISIVVLMLLPFSLALDVTPNSFTWNVSHNSTYSDHFRITPSNQTTVNIFMSSPFDISLSVEPTLNISTYADIDFDISVPVYFSSGTYKSYIFVEGENQTKKITITLVVLNDNKITLENKTIIFNRNSGDSGILYTKIKNTGNTIQNISINSTCNYLTTPNNIKIYPNFEVNIPISYNIPTNIVKTNYTCEIKYGSETQKWNMTITDDTSPTILDIFYPDKIKSAEPFLVRVDTFDNINISNVSFKMDNKSYEFEYDDGFYTRTLKYLEKGNITGKIYVNDTSGNVAEKNITFELFPCGGVNASNFDFLQITQNKTIMEKIFESEKKIDVEIKLLEFNFTPIDENEEDYELFIEIDNENRDLEINKKIEIESLDEMYMGFMSKSMGYYSGKLMIYIPDWVGDDILINISGKVGDLTIPSEYDGHIGDYYMRCEAKLGETISESKYKCYIEYPIDTNLESLGIFFTKEMSDTFKGSLNTTIDAKDELIHVAKRERNILVMIIVITYIIFFIYYFIIKRGILFMLGV